MIIGIILTILGIIALWEELYLWFFVSSLKRFDITTPKRIDISIPKVTNILFPEPTKQNNKQEYNNGIENQVYDCTPEVVIITPIRIDTKYDTDSNSKKDDSKKYKNKCPSRLVYPHDGILLLARIIMWLYRRVNQKQTEPK